MSQSIDLSPKQTETFRAVCAESGVAVQVFYPPQKGAARRVEVKASVADVEALKELAGVAKAATVTA
jgi:hypothetical protein